MIYKSHYLKDKTYDKKEDLFTDLKANLNEIMAFKKGVQKSFEKGLSVSARPLDASKLDIEQQKAINVDSNFYYIVVNTTKILDSHDDVHIDGLWKKTISEKQFQNYLVLDHELEVLNTVVRKEHVEIFTAKVPFSSLGKTYEGNTEALIYKVPKDKIMIPLVKEWLDSGDSIQASVRMKYIKFIFCMDSNAPEDAEFKKNYDEYINQIANKNEFEYIPYFFAIKEASNELESSLVIRGSNKVTGMLEQQRQQEEKEEPTEVTQNKEEAEKSLREQELLKELLKKFNTN